MSGFAGIVSCNDELSREFENVTHMTKTLLKRGSSNVKVKNYTNAIMGETDFETHLAPERLCPISALRGEGELCVCFDGLIYNSSELLCALGENADADFSDAELVLSAYSKWGAGCVRRLNGIFAFAIWDEKRRELFLARDRFGIKPLYFTLRGERLYFSSEIKGLLAHPSIDAVIDKTGLCEILGFSPARVRGSGVFKNIREIMPANCATFNKNGFNTYMYWQLSSHAFTETFDECLEHTRELVFSAVDRQLEKKGRDLCFFLSGGLDSSAIVALAAKKYGSGINTFSLKYKGNDEFFSPTEYQPASDDEFIAQMVDTFGTTHTTVEIDSEGLIKHLGDAVSARDLPGMADVDSSLYFLCREMGNDFSGALSGECADEIFGGYPWFHRQEDFEADIFPWAKNLELRRNLVNPQLMCGDEIEIFIREKYAESIESTPRLLGESDDEARRREIAFLNLNWFMYTLGARSERIGMNCGLEIRMPFCDSDLAEYMWNVPWKYKAYEGREKGLLRKALVGVLPDEILHRKKSPFPKTHNPEYESMVKGTLLEILEDKSSAICGVLNKEYLKSVMTQPSDCKNPWFGQLMQTPQLFAYAVQTELWLKKYKVRIEI